jgi:hypothetical protein
VCVLERRELVGGACVLCGAGTHPGGGVMAACGHNAAMRVLRARKRSELRRKLPPWRNAMRSGHGAPPSWAS